MKKLGVFFYNIKVAILNYFYWLFKYEEYVISVRVYDWNKKEVYCIKEIIPFRHFKEFKKYLVKNYRGKSQAYDWVNRGTYQLKKKTYNYRSSW
jgi:hypothetical protein